MACNILRKHESGSTPLEVVSTFALPFLNFCLFPLVVLGAWLVIPSKLRLLPTCIQGQSEKGAYLGMFSHQEVSFQSKASLFCGLLPFFVPFSGFFLVTVFLNHHFWLLIPYFNCLTEFTWRDKQFCSVFISLRFIPNNSQVSSLSFQIKLKRMWINQRKLCVT